MCTAPTLTLVPGESPRGDRVQTLIMIEAAFFVFVTSYFLKCRELLNPKSSENGVFLFLVFFVFFCYNIYMKNVASIPSNRP